MQGIGHTGKIDGDILFEFTCMVRKDAYPVNEGIARFNAIIAGFFIYLHVKIERRQGNGKAVMINEVKINRAVGGVGYYTKVMDRS